MRESCAAPDKAKEIIRVVIKGSSGYRPVEEAFEDKVVITRDSIRYEYIPYLDSETNPIRKWSYKTNSPVFQKIYDELAVLLPEVLTRSEIPFVRDIGTTTFIVTYVDKSKESRTFLLPGDEFKTLFCIIKKMVPGSESVPLLLQTSEDYED